MFKLSGIASLVLAASCQFQPLADFPPADSPAGFDRQTLPSLVMRTELNDGLTLAGRLEVRSYSEPDAALDTPAGPILQQSAAKIQVRGQSSAVWPKKSFALETLDTAGGTSSNNLALLGLPSDNDYVLHSLWSDKTMARNRLIYAVAGEIEDWAPRTKYFELWGNQITKPDPNSPGDQIPSFDLQYQGVYLLVEKIKAGSHRVPVVLGATAADPMGGLIFQIDKGGDDDTWSPGTWKTHNLSLKRPAAADLTEPQKAAVGAWVDQLETTLRATPVGDWRSFLDEASFVDFTLLNEVGKNVDGYRISTYLHKPAGGKLKAGPVWDFDLGMANDGRSFDPEGWVILWESDPTYGDWYKPPFWWNELLHDAEFRQALRARWQQLRGSTFSTDHLIGLIDDTVRQVSPAVNRNFATWPSLNTNGDTWWTPIPIYGVSDVTADSYTYADHVRSLKAWFRARLAWLDSDAAWAELDQWAVDQPLHLDQGGNL